MQPESHSLESSFEPTGDPIRSGASGAPDPIVEDFNAFFERLSSLDDLQWSADSSSAPVRPQAPAKREARPARKPAVPPGPKAKPARPPRMTVLKSDSIPESMPVPDSLPSLEAFSVPEAGPALPSAEERVNVRDVARFLKTTLVGLVLFALGLAAGWAALSLPGRFHHHMPSIAQLAERARAISLPHLGTSPADNSAAPAAKPDNDTTGASSQYSDQATAAKATQDSATTPDAMDPDANLPLPKLGDTVTIPASHSHANRHGSATQSHARAAHHAAPAAVATANPPAKQAAAQSGPRYTLQVGACTSYACVAAYKRLLQSKVDPHTIKVVTETRKGAPNLQRVRIQPLSHDEAERLKSKLAALDPRFKGAYLIALH